MRIGIMLRSVAQRGGVGIYARNIVEELLKIDRDNEYFLYYRDREPLGRFASFHNTHERLVEAKATLVWDQVLIPRAAKRDRIDVLFHPKFTLPLFVQAKTVMAVHGADWFLPEYRDLYHPLDVLYMRAFMPLYLRRADAVISVSNFSTHGFARAFPRYASKLRTIYFAAKDIFRPVPDAAALERIREKWKLPEHFLLTVIHYDSGRKNFANMLQAFQIAKRSGLPHKFVVVGRDCEKYAQDHSLDSLGLADQVQFFGWIEQADLPAIYNLADLYLYPTRVEAFPIPICEAMACGCPIVTSNETGLKEIAADAALLVDPNDPVEIADAIRRVLDDDSLRAELRRKGIARSKSFSWDNCARETLELLESLRGVGREFSAKPAREVAG